MTHQPPTIEELFPGLSQEELKMAEENLDLYLKLVLRILDRLESNRQAIALTPSNGTLSCTLPHPGSSP